MHARARLYTRELPGGGYVVIDLLSPDGQLGAHLRLWVERRADATRRAGHSPPVLIETETADPETDLAQLQRIASDNVAVAQAIRRWQRERGLGSAG